MPHREIISLLLRTVEAWLFIWWSSHSNYMLRLVCSMQHGFHFNGFTKYLKRCLSFTIITIRAKYYGPSWLVEHSLAQSHVL